MLAMHTLSFFTCVGLHTLRDHRTLIKWIQSQIKPYGIVVNNLSSSWSNGMALCALIHRYRPDIM